jgi:peptidyl-prolyl cis-trans isomerase D
MAVLSKIRQRSFNDCSYRICFICIYGDLFKSGGFDVPQRCRKHQWKDISFEDFRIKVSEVEKSGQGITSTAAATEYGIKRFRCFID